MSARSANSNLSRNYDGSQRQRHVYRQMSASKRPASVSRYDAYSFALRTAYLSHLLQPRIRQKQHVPAPTRPQPQRQSSSVTDLVKDFSLVRDSKSTRFPRGFMNELDKRMTGVLMGVERMPEYGDALVKRTFAVFLNHFKRPEYRKMVEADRRVEDLLLIFFSNATKELQKGKAPDDDSWKLMVDRHVALFVRLISSTLKGNDWQRDRPELTSRLQTLESKLLRHDQDLSAQSQRNGGAGGSTIDVEVPRSQKIKDMPFALTVATMFDKTAAQAQADIDDQKEFWTAQAALQDLKMYWTNLSLNSPKTLRVEDFDTQEAYEIWKKSETPNLSQMMLAIIQSNLDLAKNTPGILPQLKPGANGTTADADMSGLSRQSSENDQSSSYIIDQPVDMSALNLNGDTQAGAKFDDATPYMFIPPDPRTYYRSVLKEALTRDIAAGSHEPGDNSGSRLLSKASTELLSEIGLRWRIPFVSRLILFLDVIREKFADRQIDCDVLDAAFEYVKLPAPAEKKKIDVATLTDRNRWTIADFVLNQQILNSIHDTILRDLFEQLSNCYESSPPNIGSMMTILETHIFDNPSFSRTMDDLDNFAESLQTVLRQKARERYEGLFQKEVQRNENKLEFYHIIQLGKSVLKFADKIQKRYWKTPEIMGVTPFAILCESVLPRYEKDAQEQLVAILQREQQRDQEISIPDGFETYGEMVEIRRVHSEVLPNAPIKFHIESIFETFVWRLINNTETNAITWVEGAVKQDKFVVRTENQNDTPSDEERHSTSIIDIARSFNEAIDQVIRLNWADELQYAKFMTALSKAIGAALYRYCTLLEQMFIKEMDRMLQTPETAIAQSRQEKWMQLAKDAFSTKERIEPFQFLPESFVKLNNIECAMHQLERLEKEMNVDACVDVIQRKEPQQQQARRKKNEKFVFTIKIIEAEDLKACDPNGQSDPYVVLGDEFQKRLAKTRIVYGNLNPRWDETVDIPCTGSVSITATIWDWDALGDHDCEGRTTIKLDPAHFRDYLPREYWLDLDTQGRLLVRVTMEGEKDDIQFHYGKAFRSLKRTERDMTRKITDKLSAYIHHCLSPRTLKQMMKRNNISISSISSMSKYLNRASMPQPSQAPAQAEIENTLKPLFNYLNDNFAIMQQTLTSTSMITVMTRVWKEVLSTIESLLVPPLSDKLSLQRQLPENELDIVFKWLQLLFDFFHAVDDETGVPNGVPLDVLKSPKYHDLQNLNFFYYESTDTLIRTSESMTRATSDRAKTSPYGATGPPPATSRLSASNAFGSLRTAASNRTKSIMLARNIGTMKKAKAEKRKEAQAEPSDDMILRILRMRPEAASYLKSRAKLQEKLAAQSMADEMVAKAARASARSQDAPPLPGMPGRVASGLGRSGVRSNDY
ncbi:MAG: hypothetical protein M1828_004838 [Chrysothrix sp. TS-e1954]|nr:MAG: hypothetical protein M1828_004838 [Chrysothrix sp. TS-e1954]